MLDKEMPKYVMHLNVGGYPKIEVSFPCHIIKRILKMRPRFLGHNLLQTFKWLSMSRLQDFSGAWCTFCTLFKTSDEGGG
jgi:hypothetical protein